MLTLRITAGPGEGRDVETGGERFVVGREAGADLVLAEDEEASREHAALSELPDGRLQLEDLGSRNGTFVDGERIAGPVTLSGGEEVRIGTTTFEVVAPRAGETKVAAGGQTKFSPPPVAASAQAQPVPPELAPPRAQPAPPQPPYSPPVQAPAGGGGPSGGRLAALIAIPIVVLLIIGAVVMTFVVWGGISQTRYRLGLGGGWNDATVAEFGSNCASGGTIDAASCDCLIDELQKRLTQSDADDIKASNQAGSPTTPHAGEIGDSIEACDVPITPPT